MEKRDEEVVVMRYKIIKVEDRQERDGCGLKREWERRVITGEIERQKGVEGERERGCRFPDVELRPL